MIKNTTPLYILIKNALNEYDTLPRNFNLPDETDEKIKFAMGAKDGIFIYHMGLGNISKNIQYLKDAIELANVGKEKKAIKSVREYRNDYMLSSIDVIQEYIIDNKDRLNAKAIFCLGAECAFNGIYKEEVKFGLSILELFSESLDSETKKAVRILSRCDEFTIFALFIMRNWENPMQEIFETAKSVRGWGRIHAVDRLEPQNFEMEQWLFEEGWQNEILNAYSALECYNKSNCFERIKGNMSIQDYNTFCGLMKELLNEGPVSGISGIENPVEMLEIFLDKGIELKNLDEFDINNYNTFRLVKEYAEENKLQNIIEKVDIILKNAY